MGGIQIGNLRNPEVYASNYYMTEATFTFNANGVLLSCEIYSPVDIVQVVNENAATLSVDDLLKRAKEHLSLSDKYHMDLLLKKKRISFRQMYRLIGLTMVLPE